MPLMARPVAPAKVLTAIAWLDQAELAVCRAFNRTVRRAGLLRVFRIASRLGDGVLWYSLMAAMAVAGGAPGAPGRNWVERSDGSREEFGATCQVDMNAGDVFVIETPGGGGFGAGP